MGVTAYFPPGPRYAIARRTAGGSGASAPLTAYQRISFSSKSFDPVVFAEVHLARPLGPVGQRPCCTAFRSIRAGSVRIGGQIGLVGERGEHGLRRGVVLAQRRQPQDQLDRPDHAHRAVLRAVERFPLGVRADHQADGAVGVDVVGAVLGVVLDDEDRRLGPELAVRDGLDQPAQGQVVAGHAGLRREGAGPGPRGVVLAQAHDDEVAAGCPVFSNSRYSFRNVSTLSVSRDRWPAAFGTPIVGAHVADQPGHRPLDRATSRRAG